MALCRTKLARKSFLELRSFLRETHRKLPENVKAFPLWIRIHPAEFPRNRKISVQKIKRDSEMRLCRCAGRREARPTTRRAHEAGRSGTSNVGQQNGCVRTKQLLHCRSPGPFLRTTKKDERAPCFALFGPNSEAKP